MLLFNLGGYTDRRGNTHLGAGRLKLLGILYAGPMLTAKGEVRIENIPTTQRVVALSAIPINLGLVIKSSRLLEIDQLLRAKLPPTA